MKKKLLFLFGWLLWVGPCCNQACTHSISYVYAGIVSVCATLGLISGLFCLASVVGGDYLDSIAIFIIYLVLGLLTHVILKKIAGYSFMPSWVSSMT